MNIKYLNPFFLSFLICISFIVSANKNDDTKNMFLVHKTPTCGCCKRWMEHYYAKTLSTQELLDLINSNKTNKL